MKTKPLPDLEYLKTQMSYDHLTGHIAWKERRPGRSKKENVGYTSKYGYRYVSMDGGNYFVHRLAWYLYYGEDPSGVIDHKDGDRSNNRIENLRLGTQSQNMQNQKACRSNNQSGYLGVAVHFAGFTAQINVKGKKIHLGLFQDPAEAHQAYLDKKRELHEFCEI